MTTLGPSEFVWLQFDDKSKMPEEAQAVAALEAALAKPGVSDLVIVAHGWQTDRPGAQGLYSKLWSNAAGELTARGLDPSKMVVAGVLWPSKRFNSQYDGGEALTASAGGALSVGGSGGEGDTDLPDADFEAVLEDLRSLLGDEADTLIAKARAAAKTPGEKPAFEFFDTARKALGHDPNDPDPELAQDAKLFQKAATPAAADALLSGFALPTAIEIEPGTGAAKGIGSAINSVFQGGKQAVGQAANLMTYFTMKKRAGEVGTALGGTILPKVHAPHDIRLHLVGHSFGGRLVTAVANALPTGAPIKLASLTLLQAAYSQNGMTDAKGPYAAVKTKIPGPIAMTYTHNDWCCTLAYPLASRLVGDTAKALGDKNDPFGAMGANGAQLPAAFLAPDSATTDFEPVKGKVNRFLADAYVKKSAESDAHNSIYNPTCGKLVARVIQAGQ